MSSLMFHGHLLSVLKAVSRKVRRVLFASGFCLWVLVCLGFRGLGIFLDFFPLFQRKQVVIIKRFGKLKGSSSSHIRDYSFSLAPEIQVN